MDIRHLSIVTMVGIALALVTGASAKMFFVYEGVDVNDAIVVNIGEE